MEKSILISRDSKGKIRLVIVSYSENEDGTYTISRNTGQLGGKITPQPDIVISKGKAKRSILDQTELEYKSKVSGYKDKGYKHIPAVNYKDAEKGELPTELVDKILPLVTTDSNGAKKPQLAKDYNKVSNSVLEKKFLASRKLDGVRCQIFYDKENDIIKTSSRGGKQYDFSTQYIVPELVNFFKEYPDVTLDGELYIHGKPLQWISGVCRVISEDNKDWKRIEKLQYHIYDVIYENDDKSEPKFEERHNFIVDVLEEMIAKDNNKVIICEHEEVEGWTAIEKLHNKYIDEGYEGVVLRDPTKEYKADSRDNRMIKVKLYQDDEFEIVGFTPGKLREEDFSFTCITKEGKEFGAKPMGTVEERLEYLEDMDNIIGKKATVKFFGYSTDGIPTQTHLKAIRDYE